MPYGTSYRYRLHDGSEIPAKISNGWCFNCGGPKNIQSALAPDQLQELSEHLRYKLTHSEKPKFLGIFSTGPSPQEQCELEDARVELDWIIKLRRLIGDQVVMASCLNCGSTAVSEFSLPQYGYKRRLPLPFAHPDCGGQLLIAESVRISVVPKSPIFISLRPPISQEERVEAPLSQLSSTVVDKNELVKVLVRLRIRNDPMARQMGFDETIVHSLAPDQIAGLPESTILTIVETWAILRKKKILDSEIFSRIEQHRSQAFPLGQMPSPLTLTTYVKYRLRLEHAHGLPLDDSFVDAAIATAKRTFLV
jgi:hypothetical protein